jgi:hypothetical protein
MLYTTHWYSNSCQHIHAAVLYSMAANTFKLTNCTTYTHHTTYTHQQQQDGHEGHLPVVPYVINPKSITLNKLYGAYDLATFEWSDGILSTIFKTCAEDERLLEKWILFDGPVDALWIESMNSVMDDNKILTLINGDRIPLTATMSLVFEVDNLEVASPATVSRAGMIYMDVDELGWQPFVNAWLNRSFPEVKSVTVRMFNCLNWFDVTYSTAAACYSSSVCEIQCACVTACAHMAFNTQQIR